MENLLDLIVLVIRWKKSISRIGILHLPKNIDLHILLMDSIGCMVMQILHIKRQIVFQ